MISGLPFDDFRSLIARMPAGDEAAARRTRDVLLRNRVGDAEPGRLGEIAVWLSRWTGKAPAVRRPLVAMFAGAHGIAAHGISRSQPDSTALMVERSAAGKLPLNQVCAACDLGLQVYDLAIDIPTGDISQEAALDEKSCAATMAFGMEAVAGGIDLLCVGAFGVGDETIAAAILSALRGTHPAKWIDDDDDAMTARRIELVETALALHGSQLGDPLELLRRLGGRQFAAVAGAILAARMQHVPVVLDGIVAIACAALLKAMRGDAVDHCVLAQLPRETAFASEARSLGFAPIFEAQISGEEGIAGALAAGVLKAAASLVLPQIGLPPGH